MADNQYKQDSPTHDLLFFVIFYILHINAVFI